MPLLALDGELRLIARFGGALDHGIDDVRLMSRLALLAHELPDFFFAIAIDAPGLDRSSSGRKFIEHADVEVAVQRERKRAGNGRRGHDQHVRFRISIFSHQAEALHDPETVLLIDDHQADAVELDLVLDERMGADDELGIALGEMATDLALAIFLKRAGEQHDAISEWLEQAPRRKIVLRGEDLRRRHERDLKPILDGDYGRFESDQSFAGADIALQETAHGRGLLHVAGDLFEHAFLRFGGAEGEEPLDGVAHADRSE